MSEASSVSAGDGAAVDTSVITVRHPEGSVKLNVPTDIAVGELMPEFLDVTRQPGGDGWLLGPPGGHPYPLEKTLADLGVADGTVLVLCDRNAGTAAEPPGESRGSVDRRKQVSPDRPVSARTARTLPERLSGSAAHESR